MSRTTFFLRSRLSGTVLNNWGHYETTLTAMVEAGERAVMLFVVQRTDCDAFEACHDLDPAYATGLTEAAGRGVEVLARACEISPQGVRIAHAVPWRGAGNG
jgi:sugar fermentation stimulation protein A